MAPTRPPSDKAAKKRSPKGKKGKKGKKKKEKVFSHEEIMEIFLGVDLLKGLPESILDELARGKAQVKELKPGEQALSLAAGRTEKGPVLILVNGAMRAKAGPEGSSLALLNVVLPDEVFFDKAYDPDAELNITLETIQPCQIITIDYEHANSLLRSEASFKDRFMELLKDGTQRKRELIDDDELRPVTQYLVDQGLVGIQRLKVKRIDKCIDCDACFEACAERYGVSRLGDYQSQFDMIGVPFNCHNCVSPACKPSCKFGHIDITSGELQISDDCAGCTKCSRLCPYDAISMLPLDAVPDGFLQRSPNAKGKQLAVKCDDCIEYDDQACISACPTGSIFQISSKNLKDYLAVFALKSAKKLEKLGAGIIEVEKPPWWGWRVLFIGGLLLATLLTAFESIGRMYVYQSRADTVIRALQEVGVEKETAFDIVGELRPDIYHRLQQTPKPLLQFDIDKDDAQEIHEKLAKRKVDPWDENPFRTKYYSIAAILYHTGLSDLPPRKGGPIERGGDMKPGNTLSMLLGYLGAFAMLLSQLYKVRRAVGSRLGNMRIWLEFHIYTGYLGGMLIFFHATYMFHGYVFWLCFVPMVIAILTGVLGRYVYFLIPRSESGRAMNAEEIASKIREMNNQIEDLVRKSKGGGKAVTKLKEKKFLEIPAKQEEAQAWYKTLLGSFTDGFKQRRKTSALKKAVRELSKAKGKERKELDKLVGSRSVLEAAARRLKNLEVLTGTWRWVHIAASYLMFATMLVHVVYAWIFLGAKAFIPK